MPKHDETALPKLCAECGSTDAQQGPTPAGCPDGHNRTGRRSSEAHFARIVTLQAVGKSGSSCPRHRTISSVRFAVPGPPSPGDPTTRYGRCGRQASGRPTVPLSQFADARTQAAREKHPDTRRGRRTLARRPLRPWDGLAHGDAPPPQGVIWRKEDILPSPRSAATAATALLGIESGQGPHDRSRARAKKGTPLRNAPLSRSCRRRVLARVLSDRSGLVSAC